MTGEVSKRRSDELAELRDRYNQLCTALTLSAGANSAAAERVLQELQALAQMIAARQGEADAAAAGAPSPKRETATQPERRTGNVIALRFKLKGSGAENPRLPAALNVLTGRDASAEPPDTVDWSRSLGRIGGSATAMPAPSPTPADPALHAAVAGQGAEIERLARSTDSHRQLLERLEQRLHSDAIAPET